MLEVELLYDSNCPNVTAARDNLVRAFSMTGIAAEWKEWERSNPNAPDYARRFGSPAILINGRDVGGMPGEDVASCRLYWTRTGRSSGAPPVELIVKALTNGNSHSNGAGLSSLKPHLPVVSAILFSLLPNLACPACWPAYTGIISAFGLGFLGRSEYLLPLTAGFLAIPLACLWYRAEARHGYWPLCLGGLGSGAVLIGKFWSETEALFYVGLFALAGASIWNAWPAALNTASGVKALRRDAVNSKVLEE